MKNLDPKIKLILLCDFICMCLLILNTFFPLLFLGAIAIQLILSIIYILKEIFKTGLCQKNEDVQILKISVFGWTLSFILIFYLAYEDDIAIPAYFIVIFCSFLLRYVIPRIIYYYYRHGVF